MAVKLKIRRGLKTDLPLLAEGELGYCTDTNELFIGTQTGNQLVNGGAGNVRYDNSVSGLMADDVQEAIDELNDNSSNHITDMNNPHSVTATQVGLGNVDNTSDLNKPISTLTQNALNDKSNVGHTHTKSDITDFSHTHLIEDITDLIEATQTFSGLMSSTDKTRLDALHALLEENEANTVVDSINEILAIFNNYPEGADLVSALANKVDKNNAITAGTKTKITYDAKGLVTSGADLEETDIPELGASKITQDENNRFVTDTEKSTWNSKQSALGFTPENQENKKTTLTNNDVDFPTTKAVKTAIDTAISQTLKPMGNWNASTNTPELTNSDTSKANQVYYVNVAGTQFSITFEVGDELVYNTNGVIFKRDNVDAVISVNGEEGVVVLTQDDVADGSTYKRVTDTEKSTWNGKQDKSPEDGKSYLLKDGDLEEYTPVDISGKQDALTNVTTADIVTGTETTQKTVTAKVVHDAIMQIMFDSLGGES